MSSVVQTQTPHGPDILGGQGCQEQADVGDLVGHIVLAKDVALHNTSLASLGNVGDAPREDGVAVVGAAVPGQEADKALSNVRYGV